MPGKHAEKKYKVKKNGPYYIVVFSSTEFRVPGTAAYDTEKGAKQVADHLNKNR